MSWYNVIRHNSTYYLKMLWVRNIQVPCQLHCNQIFTHAILSLIVYNHCFTLMLL